MTAVEVCPICDIAGCHHIRDRKSHQMTDEELDALVKQAMDRAIERLQKLHSYAGRPAWDQVICEELSQPFTTLRAQLAEAREERGDAIIKRAAWELDAKIQQARADRAEAALAEAREERDDYAYKLMQANNTYTEMHLEIERLRDKLDAKGVK